MIHPGLQASEVLKRLNAVLRITDIGIDVLVNMSPVDILEGLLDTLIIKGCYYILPSTLC